MLPDAQAVVQHAAEAVFGKPLVNNVFRSIIVEAIIDLALDSEWEWCSGDWSAFDFQHKDGTRLEVKQSAARQSWSPSTLTRPRPAFDIAPRTGYWIEGSSWVQSEGRNADIYVFAYHPQSGEDSDHRNPIQWEFYGIAAKDLPPQRTISLGRLRALTRPVNFTGLKTLVDSVHGSIRAAV